MGQENSSKGNLKNKLTFNKTNFYYIISSNII